MVPEVPLSSPVWQIYASVMKSSLTGLSSVLNQSRCGICYHAYTHLLILSWLSCLAETIASLHALAVLPSLTHTSRKDLRLGPREHLRCPPAWRLPVWHLWLDPESSPSRWEGCCTSLCRAMLPVCLWISKKATGNRFQGAGKYKAFSKLIKRLFFCQNPTLSPNA